MLNSHPRGLILTCLFALVLTACQAAPVSPTPTVAISPTGMPTALASPTAEMTPATATSEAARVLLVEPEKGAAGSELENGLRDLAKSSGLDLAVLDKLTPADLTPATRVVVAVPPDPGMTALAAQNAGAQFLAVGIPGIKPAQNLSVIGAGDSDSSAAFLAGYIAALLTTDWRVGVVASSQEAALRDAFLNGARYLCGICNPESPPYPGYPVAVEGTARDVQSAAAALKSKGVQAVFVTPALATPDMLAGLAQAGYQLIGTAAPAQSFRSKWLATVQGSPLPAVQALWPDLMAQKGNQQAALPLGVADASPALSPGRMRLVNQVIDSLSRGLINPGAVETGS